MPVRIAGGGGRGKAKQEAAFPMSCNIVPRVTTWSMLYSEPDAAIVVCFFGVSNRG